MNSLQPGQVVTILDDTRQGYLEEQRQLLAAVDPKAVMQKLIAANPDKAAKLDKTGKELQELQERHQSARIAMTSYAGDLKGLEGIVHGACVAPFHLSPIQIFPRARNTNCTHQPFAFFPFILVLSKKAA